MKRKEPYLPMNRKQRESSSSRQREGVGKPIFRVFSVVEERTKPLEMSRLGSIYTNVTTNRGVGSGAG